MKKILMAGILGCLLISTNAMAWWLNAKNVLEIAQFGNGNIGIKVTHADDSTKLWMVESGLSHSKEVLAIALTAKSTNSAVQMSMNVDKINGILLK